MTVSHESVVIDNRVTSDLDRPGTTYGTTALS